MGDLNVVQSTYLNREIFCVLLNELCFLNMSLDPKDMTYMSGDGLIANCGFICYWKCCPIRKTTPHLKAFGFNFKI